MTFLILKNIKDILYPSYYNMPELYSENPEVFKNRCEMYCREVLDTEKTLMPAGKKLNENFSWDIVKKSAAKAINDVFNIFHENLSHSEVQYTTPVGTSFRVTPVEGSFLYMIGIKKIIISMDLRKNKNMLLRSSKKEYVVEVSIHDEKENYICSDVIGYSKGKHVKKFDNPDFNKNLENIFDEVYRLLTFTYFFDKKRLFNR
mgnify:CR=1 FL=1